ncbi:MULTISPECIES: hypothetical protein [unclassified Fibrobacter]|uniref:hypothetical protein n=1 Tax=unclassified Fibrobacter TaxID=2634177 RepID=UPI000D6BC6C8|nr:MULTISPECIES: hypothetical protein [unclassified Fibrobacter]PWJ63329.1 hypothetical protein BGX12_1185 [Fibrobacter sp. UWR4]PZW68263.1 hypothetical protein C8E88_10185 [Fibrobacter sp. UWR1]
MRKILYFILFAAAFSCAGELAEKQMAKFVDFVKKQKYEDATSSLMDHVYAFENSDAAKNNAVVFYAGKMKEFTRQHGKPLGFTKWRTRTLAKNMEEIVFQINCEKSAWMLEIHEYVGDDGKHRFGDIRYVTEEDIFKAYAK